MQNLSNCLGPCKLQTVIAVAFLVFPSYAFSQQTQDSHSTGLQELGAQAIHVVMSQEVLNSYSVDPKTGNPLSHSGKWVVDHQAPTACPQNTQSCVGVRYQVQESGVSCAWVVLLEGDGSTGKLLDQNEGATRYFLPRLSVETTKDLVQSRKTPVYPPIAMAAHASGQVKVQIIVDADGKVINTGVPAGPAMLRAAALEAVKEWKFKPYQIGSHNVPFTTVISFDFVTLGLHYGKVTSAPK